jgi:hypothetical protein
LYNPTPVSPIPSNLTHLERVYVDVDVYREVKLIQLTATHETRHCRTTAHSAAQHKLVLYMGAGISITFGWWTATPVLSAMIRNGDRRKP